MHTSEFITQPPRRRYLSIGLTTADLEPELILMRVWKNYSQSFIFCKVIRYPTVMDFYLTDSASRSQYSTAVSLSVRLTTAYLNQTKVD